MFLSFECDEILVIRHTSRIMLTLSETTVMDITHFIKRLKCLHFSCLTCSEVDVSLCLHNVCYESDLCNSIVVK